MTGVQTCALPISGRSEQMSVKDAVDMSNSPYFARVWNEDYSTPTAATWTGSVELGRTLHDVLGLGGYLVKNDHSRRKLDRNNHYRFATGEVAKLDGSMGHYQWGWGIVFYLAFWRQGPLFFAGASPNPIKGQYNYRIPIGSLSCDGHACMDRETQTLMSLVNADPRYRGGDNQASYDGTYKSLLGRPVTSTTGEAFRAAARRNGTGWLASTMRHNMVVKVLFEIIFGTRNNQAAVNPEKDKDGLFQGGLGPGFAYMPDWGGFNGYRPIVPTGVGAEKGDFVGAIPYKVTNEAGDVVYDAQIPSFFGYKHMHGSLWRIQDDEFGRCNADTTITHMVAPSIYGSWTLGVDEGMVALSTCPPKGEGYIKRMSYDHLEGYPTEFGGTESQYFGAYLWNNSGSTSGSRVLCRGCHAGNSGPSGASAVHLYNAVSLSDVSYGSLLCEAVEEWPIEPVFAEAA